MCTKQSNNWSIQIQRQWATMDQSLYTADHELDYGTTYTPITVHCPYYNHSFPYQEVTVNGSFLETFWIYTLQAKNYLDFTAFKNALVCPSTSTHIICIQYTLFFCVAFSEVCLIP